MSEIGTGPLTFNCIVVIALMPFVFIALALWERWLAHWRHVKDEPR